MDRSADLLAGQDVVARPGVVGVERHELDEADLVGVLAREAGERDHLVLGEAAHRDGVDLDRMRLGNDASTSSPRSTRASASRRVICVKRSRCSESTETLKRSTPARDERLRRRGRAGSRWSSARARAPAGSRRASPTRRGSSRRASGSPPVRRTSRTPISASTRTSALDLLEAQELVAVEPLQALGGHAVAAAEAAAIGDRDADVLDLAPMTVAQRLRGLQVHGGGAMRHRSR